MDACSYSGTSIGSHACVCTFRFKISIFHLSMLSKVFSLIIIIKPYTLFLKKKKKERKHELILAYSPLYIMSLVFLFCMSLISHVTLRIASLACQSVLHLWGRTILVKA